MLNNRFWSIISCRLLLTCTFSYKKDNPGMTPETYDILKGKWESGHVSYTNKVWVL